MSINKKNKVSKKDLEKEKRKKLSEEEEKKKEEESKKQKDEYTKRKKEWRKQELKKKLEAIEIKKRKAKKQERLEQRKKLQKLQEEKELEEFKNEAFIKDKPDEVELISISAERIKFREKKIKNNKIVLKMINKIEHILFDTFHQHVYMSTMSKTVKYIINNIKEELVDVGPLEFLHDYIYSLPPKNPREKSDYIESLTNYLLENKDGIINRLDDILDFE